MAPREESFTYGRIMTSNNETFAKTFRRIFFFCFILHTICAGFSMGAGIPLQGNSDTENLEIPRGYFKNDETVLIRKRRAEEENSADIGSTSAPGLEGVNLEGEGTTTPTSPTTISDISTTGSNSTSIKSTTAQHTTVHKTGTTKKGCNPSTGHGVKGHTTKKPGHKGGHEVDPCLEGNDTGHGEKSGHGEVERFKVAKLDFNYVKTPFMVSIFILFAILAKIFFHSEKYLSKYVPESCLLILLGIVVGGVLYVCNERSYELNTTTFFLILLPPIILDAGYFMPARPFFDNLGTILLYAILGTLFNTLCLGFSLWGIYEANGFWRLSSPLLLLDALVFASLLAAVDPVAVLAVFESVHVNEILYIVVFGESLLNDGISVVLYHLFEGLSEIGSENILVIDVIAGVGSFFVIVFGAVGIGVVLAILAGIISRFTSHVQVMEPLIVCVIGYLAFIIAEMFHLSGILACTFCGITMRKYVEVNYSTKSQTTIRYILKMGATTCEIIIFMYLGISAVSDTHQWDTAFVLITLLLCLVFRALGVILLTFFANMIRVVKLNYIDQFIMSYGGLRGAIAFALVVLLDSNHFKHRKLFITSTVVVIYFTNLILGTTIEPLVNLLKVKKATSRDLTVGEKIFYRYMDHVMGGMEDIVDQKGHHIMRERFSYINNAFLKKIIAGRKNPQKTGFHIMNTYSEVNDRAMTQALRSSPSLSTLFRTLSHPDLSRSSSLAQLVPYLSSSGGHQDGRHSNGDGPVGNKGSDHFNQSDSASNLVNIETSTNHKSRDKLHPSNYYSPQVLTRPKGRYKQHSNDTNLSMETIESNIFTLPPEAHNEYDNGTADQLLNSNGGIHVGHKPGSNNEQAQLVGDVVSFRADPDKTDKARQAEEIVSKITESLIKAQNLKGCSNPAYQEHQEEFSSSSEDENKSAGQKLNPNEYVNINPAKKSTEARDTPGKQFTAKKRRSVDALPESPALLSLADDRRISLQEEGGRARPPGGNLSGKESQHNVEEQGRRRQKKYYVEKF